MLIVYAFPILIVGICVGILIAVNVDDPNHEKRERARHAGVTPEMQRVFEQAGPARALEYFNRDVYRKLMELQKKP